MVTAGSFRAGGLFIFVKEMINIAIKLLTSVTYTAPGEQTTFAIPFDYLRPAFVYVSVDEQNITEGFEVVDRTVKFSAPPAKGAVVRIYRSTTTKRLVSWADASILKAKDMTAAEVQQLHLIEEEKDWSRENTVHIDKDGVSSNQKFDPSFRVKPDAFIKTNSKGTGLELYDKADMDADIYREAGKYINDHPEYVTTVKDNTLTESKFMDGAVSERVLQDEAVSENKLAPALAKKKASWYKSVAEMKADNLLSAGMTAQTLGYYAPNDGGAGTYIIRAKQESDVDDGGSLHELVNGNVAELVVENGTVNVKQFGAKDGDIGEIINNIISQLSINVVFFPIGTYLIANTINVDKGILLKGEDKIQTILNVNADVGFNVTTNYVTPFEIQNMKFIGTDTNTLLIADRKKWGACFKLRDFYLNGFKKAYIAKSAYNTLIENGTIISDAIAEYTTFDEPASNTNFSNDNTIRNVYWQGTKQGYIFYLNNVRSLKIKNCTFEHKEYIFEFKDTSNIDMITLEGCWIEDIKYLCLKDDGLRKITGTNNKFAFFTAFTTESDINRLSSDDNIYVLGSISNVGGSVLQSLFNDTKSVSLLSRRISTLTGDYSLLDFSTKQLKSYLPINTVMNRVDGSDEYTYNIENALNNETCAAIVKIICLVVFSDYSSAVYEGEILRQSYNTYAVIKWEKVKVLSTGEQSVVNKAAVTLSAKNNEYSINSDVTVARFTVATSVNVLGSTVF